MFLIADQSDVDNWNFFYEQLKKEKVFSIVCLDQVTDIQNAAAIMRTSAFFGVNYLVVPQKGSFRLSPAFFRLSSGGSEYVKVIKVNSLSKFLKNLKNYSFVVIS